MRNKYKIYVAALVKFFDVKYYFVNYRIRYAFKKKKFRTLVRVIIN